MADLIVLKFDTTYGAQQAMNGVRALTELNYAWLEDVAVVERHRSGRYSTHTTHGSSTGGALLGGLTGMFVGLLFPPVGFLALWAAGLGVGAIVGEVAKKHGIDPALLQRVQGSLDKDQSGLILIGAHGDADEMARAFEQYHPVDIIRESIPDEAVTNLKETLEAHEDAADAPTEETPAAEKPS